MRRAIPILVCVLAALPVRADDWYPSRWGASDTLGAVNEITPESVVAATKLVKTGQTYSLGVVTGRATPAFGTRSFELYAVAHGDGGGGSLGTNDTTFNDDFMFTWLGIGSQLDGLGHVGVGHRYYNGTPIGDFWRANGLVKFGTHEVPPIVARGVLLDIAALKGEPVLAAGIAINPSELTAAAKRQEVEIRRGDVVILHTGWQQKAATDPEAFLAGEPGLGVDGARWLAERRVVAVGADTWGVEVIPSEDPEHAFPVHQELLARNGIYILENMNTAALVADSAWEFLFVLGTPRFEGAVQMVINPVAIR